MTALLPAAPAPDLDPRAAPLPEFTLLIDGARRQPTADARVDRVDPWTGEPLPSVPVGTDAEVARALDGAHNVAARWAASPAAARADALRQGADALATAVNELAALTAREMGKPLADAAGGVRAAIGAVRQYAELGPLHRGRSLQGAPGAADWMQHVPRGVAVVLTPWNDPVAITCQLLAAALVTGNTVVLKPSERAPLTGQRTAELLGAALPPGVLQLLHGDDRTGRALVTAAPDLVLHVGSSATGREIAQLCAASGTKAVLELGGKDACVVDGGIDPAWAAAQVALGGFANAGQICTAVERVYVVRDLADEFLEALVREATGRTLGDPFDAATDLGPLVDRRLRAAVHAQVAAAGADVLVGGRIPAGPGSGYPATVVTGVDPDAALMTAETFGPVVPVEVVDTYEDALLRAARSAYGLAATVLTADMAHAQRAWRELPVGTVKVNAVFGGAPGGAAEPGPGSGQGFGYGPELLDECTRTRVVHWASAPQRSQT